MYKKFFYRVLALVCFFFSFVLRGISADVPLQLPARPDVQDLHIAGSPHKYWSIVDNFTAVLEPLSRQQKLQLVSLLLGHVPRGSDLPSGILFFAITHKIMAYAAVKQLKVRLSRVSDSYIADLTSAIKTVPTEHFMNGSFDDVFIEFTARRIQGMSDADFHGVAKAYHGRLSHPSTKIYKPVRDALAGKYPSNQVFRVLKDLFEVPLRHGLQKMGYGAIHHDSDEDHPGLGYDARTRVQKDSVETAQDLLVYLEMDKHHIHMALVEASALQLSDADSFRSGTIGVLVRGAGLFECQASEFLPIAKLLIGSDVGEGIVRSLQTRAIELEVAGAISREELLELINWNKPHDKCVSLSAGR